MKKHPATISASSIEGKAAITLIRASLGPRLPSPPGSGLRRRRAGLPRRRQPASRAPTGWRSRAHGRSRLRAERLASILTADSVDYESPERRRCPGLVNAAAHRVCRSPPRRWSHRRLRIDLSAPASMPNANRARDAFVRGARRAKGAVSVVIFAPASGVDSPASTGRRPASAGPHRGARRCSWRRVLLTTRGRASATACCGASTRVSIAFRRPTAYLETPLGSAAYAFRPSRACSASPPGGGGHPGADRGPRGLRPRRRERQVTGARRGLQSRAQGAARRPRGRDGGSR